MGRHQPRINAADTNLKESTDALTFEVDAILKEPLNFFRSDPRLSAKIRG